MSISLSQAAAQTFKKSGRRIKLSKNLKPFVSRVVRDGAVQNAFAEQIGKPVGGCVASNVKAGMSGKVIHGIAKLCSRQAVGTSLALGGGRRRRARATATEEFYEIA
jgi:hypothetical protein